MCGKRQLNGAILRMRPEKLRPCVTAGVIPPSSKGPESQAQAKILLAFTCNGDVFIKMKR
jgi:hypothetical protein